MSLFFCFLFTAATLSLSPFHALPQCGKNYQIQSLSYFLFVLLLFGPMMVMSLNLFCREDLTSVWVSVLRYYVASLGSSYVASYVCSWGCCYTILGPGPGTGFAAKQTWMQGVEALSVKSTVSKQCCLCCRVIENKLWIVSAGKSAHRDQWYSFIYSFVLLLCGAWIFSTYLWITFSGSLLRVFVWVHCFSPEST